MAKSKKNSKGKSKAKSKKESPVSSATMVWLPINDIEVIEGFNPRENLGALKALVDSIKKNGIIENLVVWVKDSVYYLICGHRRLKAAVEAGMTEVPVTVRTDVKDANQALLIAIAENSSDSRYNLTPIEEAIAFNRLKEEGYNITEIALQSGLSRTKVSRTLKILELPDRVRDNVRSSLLSANAAMAIADLPEKERNAVFKNIDNIANKAQLDSMLEKISVKKKSDKVDIEYITKNRTNKDIRNAILNFYDDYKNEKKKTVQANILHIIATLLWTLGEIDFIDIEDKVFLEQIEFIDSEWEELEHSEPEEEGEEDDETSEYEEDEDADEEEYEEDDEVEDEDDEEYEDDDDEEYE